MKKKSLFGSIGPTLALAGGSAAAGIIGGALGPSLPAGMTNPLTAAGEGMATFVKPMATVTGAGMVLGQLRRLRKRHA